MLSGRLQGISVRRRQERRRKMENSIDPARWAAVLTRDTTQDGVFWYGVRTTGVYCRPSCASRVKRRENVRFFEDQASAIKAGFRACLRCKPEG
jgi:AraC family transcriptional regulator of adaptative response/methylated-DNA-[protein]-cysteine methyltransferase